MLKIFSKLFDYNSREISRMNLLVAQIASHEAQVKKLNNSDFPLETNRLKQEVAEGKSLDSLLPYAYALVREASFRVLGERHFDAQILAGIALHEGKIAEQKTGEGKTLSATTPLYLNALTGRGVHLVTVNDYLAKRDAGWMGRIFDFLGLTTSAIIGDESLIFDSTFHDIKIGDWRLQNMRTCTRKEAYLTDITYGINSEFGFDYLRDNMVGSLQNLVQRDFHFAIIDEVDSVLIDEARTPHIISSPYERDVNKYYDYANIVKRLDFADYKLDEKLRTAHLTEGGILKIEKMLGVDNIYEKDFDTVFHVEAALKAEALFKANKDYIVREGEVMIVDEFTGRLLPGRRFSEGIHQALEAKEGVAIQQESKTLATVSLQNYFRLYDKLAGMTGTASTEAEEFNKIYSLETLIIPPHRNIQRKDYHDLIYKTENGKYEALAREVKKQHATGRPVLVGTTSIEKNELFGQILTRQGIPHTLLNAKNHEQEASIIAQAGTVGAVTVATNMAGRGVDIILGGPPPSRYEIKEGDTNSEKQYSTEKAKWQIEHDKVVGLGGLFVMGTERHESRRIDNQLRGRAGRQGDPGETRFFVSLNDDLMRIFGGEQVERLMNFFNIPEDEPLEHGLVSKALEQAQIKVESFNFDSRKNLVEFDDVLNKQREIFYALRRSIVQATTEGSLIEIFQKLFDKLQRVYLNTAQIGEDFNREWLISSLSELTSSEDGRWEQMVTNSQDIQSEIKATFETLLLDKKTQWEGNFLPVGQIVSLETLDEYWTEHLTAIDDMRSGINLRAHAQLDPLVEYKNEAYTLFENLLSGSRSEILHRFFAVKMEKVSKERFNENKEVEANYSPAGSSDPLKIQQQNILKTPIVTPLQNKKIGRNDACWCGSGKKYKKCHFPN